MTHYEQTQEPHRCFEAPPPPPSTTQVGEDEKAWDPLTESVRPEGGELPLLRKHLLKLQSLGRRQTPDLA